MTKEQLREKFNTDYRWLFRGVLAVNMQQTADERVQENVKYHNNRGFTPADAKFLCSIAKSILKGWGLSQKQIFITRKKMQKYAGQCLNLAKAGIRVENVGKMEDAIHWTLAKFAAPGVKMGPTPSQLINNFYEVEAKQIAIELDNCLAKALETAIL